MIAQTASFRIIREHPADRRGSAALCLALALAAVTGAALEAREWRPASHAAVVRPQLSATAATARGTGSPSLPAGAADTQPMITP
jgi:23S rRNA G2445 N2-methylase RlmL